MLAGINTHFPFKRSDSPTIKQGTHSLGIMGFRNLTAVSFGPSYSAFSNIVKLQLDQQNPLVPISPLCPKYGSPGNGQGERFFDCQIFALFLFFRRENKRAGNEVYLQLQR